jgi:hypothetical protein
MHERTTPKAHSPPTPNINHVTMGANMCSVVAPQVRKRLDHGQHGNAQKLQPHEKACPGARGGQLLLQAAKRKVTSDKLTPLHSAAPPRTEAAVIYWVPSEQVWGTADPRRTFSLVLCTPVTQGPLWGRNIMTVCIGPHECQMRDGVSYSQAWGG